MNLDSSVIQAKPIVKFMKLRPGCSEQSKRKAVRTSKTCTNFVLYPPEVEITRMGDIFLGKIR